MESRWFYLTFVGVAVGLWFVAFGYGLRYITIRYGLPDQKPTDQPPVPQVIALSIFVSLMLVILGLTCFGLILWNFRRMTAAAA